MLCLCILLILIVFQTFVFTHAYFSYFKYNLAKVVVAFVMWKFTELPSPILIFSCILVLAHRSSHWNNQNQQESGWSFYSELSGVERWEGSQRRRLWVDVPTHSVLQAWAHSWRWAGSALGHLGDSTFKSVTEASPSPEPWLRTPTVSFYLELPYWFGSPQGTSKAFWILPGSVSWGLSCPTCKMEFMVRLYRGNETGNSLY